MKKTITLVAAVILCLGLLAGCGCKHETWNEADCLNPKTCAECGEIEGEPLGHTWAEATCEAPKTCTACGATEGEALGHTWADATCEAPKTCTACGETEGEALGHSFGEWDFGTEDMTRTCTVCSGTETTEIDREIWLRHILEGSWDLLMEVKDGSVTFQQAIDGFRPMALSFHGDNQGYWHMGTEALTVTWEAVDFNANPGLLCASLRTADQSDSTIIYVDPSLETVYFFTSETEFLVFFRNQSLTQALTGAWADTDSDFDTLKLSADHTFTGSFERYNRDAKAYIREDISGIWYVSPEYDYGGLTFCDLCLSVNKDGTDEEYMAAVYLGVTQSYSSDSLQHGQLEMTLKMDSLSYSLEGMDDEAYAELEYATQYLPCGPWTSTEIYKGSDHSETDAYSITFAEDGTFTAVLDTERTGTWDFEQVYMYENGTVDRYVYRLIFDGIEDYFLFTTYVDGVTSLSFYGHDCSIYFQQMTEEKIAEREAIRKENAERLVGPWGSTEIYLFSDGSTTATDAYSINFAEDGTFTAVLDTERTGTWAFDQAMKDEEGTVYGYRYSLTFEGVESTSGFIFFEINKDGDAFFCSYNHNCYIYFQQMTEEKIAEREAARAETAERVAGTWTSFCRAHEDGQDNWRGYSITFAEDGAFIAVLDQEYTGTWEYGFEYGSDDIAMHDYKLRFDDISVVHSVSLWIYDSSYPGHSGDRKLGISYQDQDGKSYTIWFEQSG